MRRQFWGGLLFSGGLLLAVAGCGGTGVNNATVTAVVKPAGTAVAGAATAAAGPAGQTAVTAAGTAVAGAVKPGATAAAGAGITLTVPERGTPKEQLTQLWEATKPVLKADAAATLNETERQARRLALTTPWAAVQARMTGGTTKEAQEATKVLGDIMALIGTLYGGDAAAKSQGAVTQQMVDQQVTAIDQAIKALP